MAIDEKVSRYLDNDKVKSLIKEAHNIRDSGQSFSDIIDNEGHQYVDLVQEGGGVLGVALVGYTYLMEEAGLRFFSLAGTSAGAINTLMLASVGKIGEAKSIRILKILESQNLFDLVDGNRSIKKLIQAYIEGRSKAYVFLRMGLAAKALLKTLFKKLGLNPGDEFEKWITNSLADYQITTIQDLNKRLKDLPDTLHHRDGTVGWTKPEKAKLKIVASEITTQSKVYFPMMSNLYWSDWEKINPSKLVRASMSIPYFFFPLTVNDIPEAGKESSVIWNTTVGYDGKVPESVKFVDGGLLSNFPIDAFHISGKPSRPTFGAKLSALRKKQNKSKKLFQYSGAMLDTVRHLHDFEFLLRNKDYRQLITAINPDTNTFNWLDFNMSSEKKVQLFELGAEKALSHLKKFNWEEYKRGRESGFSNKENLI